jgi:uncharacterized protein
MSTPDLMPRVEYKHADLATFEFKSEELGEFAGYAATFARDSDGDKFDPAAFAKSVKEKKGKIAVFLNHDRAYWAGASSSLSEDHKGLWIEAKLFLDTSAGRDAWGTIKGARALNCPVGLSVGFITIDQDWDERSQTRVIKEADLWETSITPFPANRGARIEESKGKKLRNCEQLARDVTGCSPTKAKRLVSMYVSSGLLTEEGNPLTPARDVRGMRQLQEYGNVLKTFRVLKETVYARTGNHS